MFPTNMATNPVSKVKTTETSLKLVTALKRLETATIDELADNLGLASSTVHRHLTTLHEYGYVTKTGKTYRIGLQFLTVGGVAQRRITGYPIIKQKVDLLADKTDERAQFIVEEQGERIYLYTEVGASSVQTGAHIGKRGTIHNSAAGKAILAELPERTARDIIDRRGLRKSGPNSITNEQEFWRDLEEVREKGYALNLQETTEGVHAVGAAVSVAEGEVVGALSVSGPSTRLKKSRLEDEIADLILSATNEIKLHIHHSTQSQ